MRNDLAEKYKEILDRRRPHECRTPEVDTQAVDVANTALRELRKEMLKTALDPVERIALAVFIAFETREESYDPTTHVYMKGADESMAIACAATGVSSRLYYVVHLAQHWSNDLANWADNVLSNGSVEQDEVIERTIDKSTSQLPDLKERILEELKGGKRMTHILLAHRLRESEQAVKEELLYLAGRDYVLIDETGASYLPPGIGEHDSNGTA